MRRDQRRKVLRRSAGWLESDLYHAGTKLSRSEAFVDFAVESRNDVRGHPHGPEKSVVSDCREGRQAAFDHGGHVRQLAGAGGARDGNGLDLAFANERQERRPCAQDHLDAASQHVRDRLRAAFVRNAGDVGPGRHFERFTHQVGQRALPITEVQRAGICFCIGDELLQRIGREGRRNHQHERRAADCHDRNEVLDRIIGETAGDKLRDHVGRSVRVEQGVAIGLRRHDRFQTNRCTATRTVVDDGGLAQTRRQDGRDHPGHHVIGGPGCVRKDHLDRPVGIGLGLRLGLGEADAAHAESGRRRSRQQASPGNHRFLHSEPGHHPCLRRKSATYLQPVTPTRQAGAHVGL